MENNKSVTRPKNLLKLMWNHPLVKIVPNSKCGRCLCYWSKMPHILAQKGLMVFLDWYVPALPEMTFKDYGKK